MLSRFAKNFKTMVVVVLFIFVYQFRGMLDFVFVNHVLIMIEWMHIVSNNLYNTCDENESLVSSRNKLSSIHRSKLYPFEVKC